MENEIKFNKGNNYQFDHQRIVKISTCTINQWAMDFDGNKKRIIKSIIMAREENSNIRIGPELEITGYGCEDHFLELDTINHSWEVLAEILSYEYQDKNSNKISPLTHDIICDIGMPVIQNGVLFNCRIIIYNSEILLIRPKTAMADDGNYREGRWFTPWSKGHLLEDFNLPEIITRINNQTKTKFGIAMIFAKDLSYASEICEELWIPYSPSVDFSSCGCEIIGNSSGSHFEINKQERRYELILNSSKKNGGVFIYSNLIGCDGGRTYFDGGSFIAYNGKVLAEGSRFSLNEIELVSTQIDLNEVTSYRSSIKSRCSQSGLKEINVPIIYIEEYLLKRNENLKFDPFYSIKPKDYSFEEEISFAPPLWLWDYLRRSGASGFFLALSGGADSACVATIVSLLTRMLYEEIVNKKNELVLYELRRVMKDSKYFPKSYQEICNLIFVTAYMGTEYSSEETRSHANNLGGEIGSYHLNYDIDKIYSAFKDSFTENFGKENSPKFSSEGGSYVEDLALQNIQARIRMVVSYMLAGLVSWTRKRKGFLLVLSSGNLDEGITGYMTKYDCSSADLNPIGSISKNRLKKFLQYCLKIKDIKSLERIIGAVPTAELRPQTETKQTDEEDIGILYDELSLLGRLRKDYKSGPYSMFRKLQTIWNDKSNEEILNKVKLFFRRYSINRHKMTTITPSLHCESYSLDDNRFDLRQFLYNTDWTFQFGNMDKFVKENSDGVILI